MTIFEKIIARQIPAEIVLENEKVLAFRDVNPQAPVHVLIVPKRVIPRLADAAASDRELLGELLLAAGEVAKKLGLKPAFVLSLTAGQMRAKAYRTCMCISSDNAS